MNSKLTMHRVLRELSQHPVVIAVSVIAAVGICKFGFFTAAIIVAAVAGLAIWQLGWRITVTTHRHELNDKEDHHGTEHDTTEK